MDVVVVPGVDAVVLAGVEVVEVTAAAGLTVTTRLNRKRETVVGAAVGAAVGAVVGVDVAVVDVVAVAAGLAVTTCLKLKRETVVWAAVGAVVGAAVGADVGAAVDEAVWAADRGADGGAVAVVEPTPVEDVIGADGTSGAAKTASIPWLAGARPKKIFLSYEWIYFSD